MPHSDIELDNLICAACNGYITVGDALKRDAEDDMVQPAQHAQCPQDPLLPPPKEE